MPLKIEKFKYQGEEATVYELNLDKSYTYNNTRLPKGRYIVKKYIRPLFNLKDLKSLSNLKLIPKIYYAKKDIVIMQFIKGETVYDFIRKNKNRTTKEKVYRNIVELLHKWHRHNKTHCDLNLYNILVDKDLKVYLIDPMLDKCGFSSDREQLQQLKISLLGHI